MALPLPPPLLFISTPLLSTSAPTPRCATTFGTRSEGLLTKHVILLIEEILRLNRLLNTGGDVECRELDALSRTGSARRER